MIKNLKKIEFCVIPKPFFCVLPIIKYHIAQNDIFE